MDKKIVIYKNPDGDTRTAPKGITFEQFHMANLSHKDDVANVMKCLSDMIIIAGIDHDWTKNDNVLYSNHLKDIKKNQYEHLFYKDFVKAMNGELNFAEGDWYKLHVEKERHHLLSHCPEDVNLIDVIEMVVDCTVAGLARTGEVRPMEINDEIIHKAIDNTVNLIKDMVVIKDRD